MNLAMTNRFASPMDGPRPDDRISLSLADVPGDGSLIQPLQLEYEIPRPVGQSTLGPPGAVSRAMWWMSYRVGRAMAHVLVKPRVSRRREPH